MPRHIPHSLKSTGLNSDFSFPGDNFSDYIQACEAMLKQAKEIAAIKVIAPQMTLDVFKAALHTVMEEGR